MAMGPIIGEVVFFLSVEGVVVDEVNKVLIAGRRDFGGVKKRRIATRYSLPICYFNSY